MELEGLFARNCDFWERGRKVDLIIHGGGNISQYSRGCNPKGCPKQGGQDNVLKSICYIQSVSLPTQQLTVFLKVIIIRPL